jgi:hypothetical protein
MFSKSRLLMAFSLACGALVALPAYRFMQPTAAAEPQDSERERARRELFNQERRDRGNALLQRIRAADLYANASWELVGLYLWLANGARPREAVLNVRVDSGDPVQLLITSIVIARDIISKGRLDHVEVRAIGSWYGPDVENMLEPVAYATYGSPPHIPGREDWNIQIDPRIPTVQELTVLRTWRKLAPTEYFERSDRIWENYDPRAAMRQQTNIRVAEALNMTADEVAATILSSKLQPLKYSMGVSVATGAGCMRADPGLICIDQRQLEKPDQFPDPVHVTDEPCAHFVPTKHGNLPILCEFGKSNF